MNKPISNATSITSWLVRLSLSILCFQMPLTAMTRNALVIGNDSYPGNRLQNAVNDAKSVAHELKGLGYRTTLAIDADKVTMSRTIQIFSDTIQPGDLTIVYYAGHGLQVAGENYLVPVDFRVSDEADAVTQGYPLSGILDKLTLHGAKTQVIILDSCRDNPFLASRSTTGGWASLGTSIGTFLAFGTAPGSTASDDPTASHGLFTNALLAHIGDSSVDIEGLFQLVRDDVVRESYGRQVPWTSSSLLGSLHIDPQADASAPALTRLDFAGAVKSGASGRSIDGDIEAGNASLSPSGSQDNRQELIRTLLTDARSNLRNLNLGKAIGVLQAILQLDPRCSLALRLLAVAMHLAGRNAESEEAIDRAIAIDPTDAKAYAYSCLLLATEDTEHSRQRCRRGLDLKQDMAAPHLGLSFGLFIAGNGPQSYSEATEAIRLDPASTEAITLRQNIPVEQQGGHADLPQPR